MPKQDALNESGLKKSGLPGLVEVSRYFNEVAAHLVEGVKRRGELVSATKRTVTRKRGLVMGLWIISCAIVFASVLVAPPARGGHSQNRSSGGRWSPSAAQPVESAGEIVLTFTAHEQGRVGYSTRDDCATYPWESQECGRPMARASEDFGAVKGEWIFTEAGSRAIRIPILDDDLDEADFETLFVGASFYNDLGQQTTWDMATIRIEDDDPRPDSDDPSSSSGSSLPVESSSQAGTGGATPPPQTETGPTEVSRPDRDAASTELRPGPGFELIGSGLVSGQAARARLPEDKGGITKTVFLLLAAVIVSGGGAWIWRRRSSW